MTTATITEQRIAATVTETTIAATVTETTIAATIGNAPGAQGPAGPGVPSGGTTGQVPRKASTTDYDTAWDTLDAADVGADAAGTAAAAVATEAAARASADSTHAALTTTAHGGIVASSDARLSDARTPTAHAASHAAAGGDPLTLAQSQITGLATALTGKEPSLGNPASDGYVLSSTALGARSWIAAPGSPFVAANDADVPLISRGHSAGQTGNLQEWQSSASAPLASVTSEGWVTAPRIGVGDPVFHSTPGSSIFDNYVSVSLTIPDLITGSESTHIFSAFRMFVDASDNTDSTMVDGELYSFNGYVTADGTRTPSAMYGVVAGVDYESPTASDTAFAMVANAYTYGSGALGSLGGMQIYFDNGGGATVTNGYGIQIQPSNDSNGAFTNLYGLYIASIHGGVTKNAAIYTDGGAHRFGDYLDLAEISDPGSPTNTHARLFCRDNAGKTELCVRFATGSVIVLTTEP